MSPNTTPPLSEASRRILARVAELLRSKATVSVEIEINDGGVRDYREVRRLRHTDLPPAPADGDGY